MLSVLFNNLLATFLAAMHINPLLFMLMSFVMFKSFAIFPFYPLTLLLSTLNCSKILLVPNAFPFRYFLIKTSELLQRSFSSLKIQGLDNFPLTSTIQSQASWTFQFSHSVYLTSHILLY